MQGIWLDITLVFQQAIQNVDSFMPPARDEVAEQRDVGIGNMVVTDPTVTPIADMVFTEQILLVKVPLRAICGGMATGAPKSGEFVFLVRVDHLSDGLVQP